MKRMIQWVVLCLFIALLSGCQEKKPVLTQTEESISFETGLVRVTMNRGDGTVTGLTALDSGEELLTEGDMPWFIHINDDRGNLVLPTCLSAEGDRILAEFENGLTAQFHLELAESFFIITLETQLPDEVDAVFFGTLNVDSAQREVENGWCISSLAMTTNATPFELPGEGTYTSAGYAMPAAGGTEGAALAVVCSRADVHRDCLKQAAERIDPERGVVSSKGGPWAMDVPGAYEDYVIVEWGLTPETAEEMAGLAADYSVEQIYLHQSSETFIQGSFTFPCALTEGERAEGRTADAALFRERIDAVMEEHGVSLGLHTYSSLVPDTALDILTDPVWQQQIYCCERYTLAQSVAPEDSFLPTVDSGASFFRQDVLIPWNDIHTAYVLVDEEIILIEYGEDGGLVVGGRGMLGTEEAPHEAGAEIRQLGGMYGMFQPTPGSELFYEIARRTGDACREGGFEIIYLDGLESISWFVPLGTEWYYYTEFIRTILSRCDELPVMDYSTFCPATWNAQGKDGGVDYATRAYKQHKENHTEYNLYLGEAYTPAALGWFHCAPDMDEGYKNTLVKTMFRDDLDRLGVLSLAYDMPVSFTNFSSWDLSGQTRLAENMGYYGLYSVLREADYFAPSVIQALRDLEQEYRLIRTEDGFAFEEMNWHTLDFEESGERRDGDNPYGEQEPIIRVEQRFSSLGEDEIFVLALDETAPAAELEGEHTFPDLDLSEHMALRIRVYGTGSAEDAILISLRSTVLVEGGRTDFLLPLDHTGWKEFWLIDSDCGDTGAFVFDVAVDGVDYECYRALPEMTLINSVTISLCGPCEGARLDDITACTLAAGTVQDPAVTVNGQTIVFETTLQGGEYIEYDPRLQKAYLYGYEGGTDGQNGRTAFCREISFRGSISIPRGEFVVTYEASALTDAPARARVALGFRGGVVTNPSDWVAPEVSIPAGAAAVWGINGT